MIPHNICLLFAFMDPKRIQHFWGRGSVWDFYNHYLYFSKQFCESVRSRLGHGEKEAIMIDVILVQSHIPYCTGGWRASESAEPGINMVFVARVRIESLGPP